MNAVNLLHPMRLGLTWARAWALVRVFADAPMPAPVPVRHSPRRFALAVLVALGTSVAIGFAAPSYAAPAWESPRYGSSWDWNADGRLVDVEVLVDGQHAPLYFKPGDHARARHYFQALQGRNYALRLRNNTSRRVGVLIAVDGLNVVNGERSGLSRGEPLYVLDPHETATIRGWRTSLAQVRRFVFVDEEKSYAERTGQANRDMGWIRVLSFEEAGRRWRDERPRVSDPYRGESDEYGSREERGEAPPAKAAPESAPRAARPDVAQRHSLGQDAEGSAPGTGWGDRRHDPVQRTWFDPARQATDHLVFRYEYASGLRALGIVPRGYRVYERDRNLGFARPPRW